MSAIASIGRSVERFQKIIFLRLRSPAQDPGSLGFFNSLEAGRQRVNYYSSLLSVGIHPLELERLLSIVLCVFSRFICTIEFPLDILGFSVYAELAPEAL